MFVIVLIQTIEDTNGTNILDQSVIKKGRKNICALFYTFLTERKNRCSAIFFVRNNRAVRSVPEQMINPEVLARRRRACDRLPPRRCALIKFGDVE